MVKAVLDAFKLLIKKPALFLPAIVLGIANLVLFYFFEETFIEFMFSLTEPQAIPASPSIAVALIQFTALNLNKILFILGIGVISLFLGLWLLFAYSRFVFLYFQGKASVKEAIGFAFKRIPRITALLGFALIVFWFYSIIVWLALFLLQEVEAIGIIVFLVVMFLGAYFFLGLVLTPVVMALEELDLNKGLRKTWAFSSKHLIEILALFIVIFAVTVVLEQISFYLTGFTENLLVGAFIGAVFFLITVSFQSLSLAVYYYSKTHKEGL
jgi:hypothetical protein